MYTHFLVPIDDSALSAINVESAVQLARSLGARITFFHATTDAGGARQGARLKARGTQGFVEPALGDVYAMLAKAAVQAASTGVPCQTCTRADDHPARAIVHAALEHGCDLVVMATHGSRLLSGVTSGSCTERVIRESHVPVMVTRVASRHPVSAAEQALAVLHGEHRSIQAVALAMQDLADRDLALGSALGQQCVASMLEYLRDFPLRIHHPKEELALHPVLRLRAPSCDALLRDIESQHADEHGLTAQTQASLERVQSEAGDDSTELLLNMRALAKTITAHIALEETSVLPLARQHLTEDDWWHVMLALKEQVLPGFGTVAAAETRHLFARMAALRLGADTELQVGRGPAPLLHSQERIT